MTLTYTKYFRFPKTDFMSEPWIQGVWDSFDAIDALMYSQAAANGTTVWLNLTQYGPGRTVIDVTDGSTWICTTAHTSAAVPTSFAQDRTANPSFWTAIMLSIQVRGQWRNNTAYNSGDMVYDTTAGRNIQALCVTKHISNAAGTINDDAAYWGFTYNSLAPTTASGIGYSNAASYLVAVNVQTAIDEVVAVKAPINSPAFTGAPTAPTPVPPNTNNNYIATTAFVTSQLSSQTSAALPAMDGVASAGALATFSRGDHVHPTDTSRAPLASPAFTGIPTAPTVALVIDATTKVATTAFVQNAIVGITGGGSIPPPSGAMPLMDATPGVVGVSPAYTREDHVHPTDTSRAAVTYVDTQDALKAPIASPAFTGTPTAPTPVVGDNSTRVATTAFSAANEIRTDIVQALTAAQQTQARQNIYAAPFDALAYNGMQINGGADVSQELGTAGNPNVGGYACDGWTTYWAGTMVLRGYGGPLSNYVPGYGGLLYIQTITAQASIGSGDMAMARQPIEGWRVARLAWGTASAQPLTLAFWSAHGKAGVYSGTIRNGANNRSYAFSYTQAAASTAQYNVITVPGDTAGTWTVDNTTGMWLTFAIAAGSTLIAPSANVWLNGNYIAAPGQTNGVDNTTDTLRITGVIVLPGIEAPSAARAPFIMRPYDQELVLCRRYWRRNATGMASFGQATTVAVAEPLIPMMRVSPTITLLNGAGMVNDLYVGYRDVSSIANGGVSGNTQMISMTTTTAGTVNKPVTINGDTMSYDARF